MKSCFYAENMQMYFKAPSRDPEGLASLSSCLSDINEQLLKIHSPNVREASFSPDLGISYLVPGPFFTMLQSGWSNSIISVPYF